MEYVSFWYQSFMCCEELVRSVRFAAQQGLFALYTITAFFNIHNPCLSGLTVLMHFPS